MEYYRLRDNLLVEVDVDKDFWLSLGIPGRLDHGPRMEVSCWLSGDRNWEDVCPSIKYEITKECFLKAHENCIGMTPRQWVLWLEENNV